MTTARESNFADLSAHPRNEFFRHWTLDPDVVFLNHGSFGATPRVVMERQAALRAEMERNPMRFFSRDYHALLDDARNALAAFVGADPRGLVFVTNATSAVNAVLRSRPWRSGDEILVTTHGYNACNNAADYAAQKFGVRVVRVPIPFPIAGPDAVTEAVLAAVTPRTRLALIDHVTSPTALTFPVEQLVRELDSRGVDALIDGAHALGMWPLRLNELGAAYYTANAHKWLCAPKGTAFLHVREDKRAEVRPLTISHGATEAPDTRPRLHHEFDWAGTADPTGWMSVPACIEFLESLLPGGAAALMERNRRLAIVARDRMCVAFGVDPPCPDSMMGSMAAVPIPPDWGSADAAFRSAAGSCDDWFVPDRIEIPIFVRSFAPTLRASFHAYNSEADADFLAATIVRRRSGAA